MSAQVKKKNGGLLEKDKKNERSLSNKRNNK
jgi:hypothetical protein